MSEKWDALRIADWFEGGYGGCELDAAAELRRLHELNAELVEALQTIMAGVAGCERDSKWEAARAALAKVEASNG